VRLVCVRGRHFPGSAVKSVDPGNIFPRNQVTVYALRRLAAAATFLYEDDRGRYWYSTQPTVTKIAEDRAELLKRNSDAVAQEIEKRVRLDLRNTGDFRRVHPLPQSSQDVSDDPEARLVVLGVDQPYSKDPNSAAVVAAKAILQSRGNSPRLLRNALVFLALDQTRLQDLDEAVRRYLAWDSIVDEAESLELAPSQLKQAQTQRDSANSAVTARLPEAYQWLIVPVQATPQSEIDWQAFRLAGSDPLAVRAAKKLRKDELLITSMAGTRLRMELDRVPLWRTEHVTVKQLAEDFGRYLYLPRLSDAQVLLEAINDGVTLLTWEKETFAYADSYDEAAGRYRGLRHSHRLLLTDVNVGMVVKPEAARRQIDAEAAVAQGHGGCKLVRRAAHFRQRRYVCQPTWCVRPPTLPARGAAKTFSRDGKSRSDSRRSRRRTNRGRSDLTSGGVGRF